jgi:hypothetical protein
MVTRRIMLLQFAHPCSFDAFSVCVSSVVEDSAPNRKLLCRLLQRLHCEVASVENGQECVDLFQELHAPDNSSFAAPPAECKFDLILMVRHGATGFELQCNRTRSALPNWCSQFGVHLPTCAG